MSLKEQSDNVVHQHQSKLSKEESTHTNIDAQLKQWYDGVVDQLQSNQLKKESYLSEGSRKIDDALHSKLASK